MKKYRILEYGIGTNRYTIEEEKLWGAYWGTPTHSQLIQPLFCPSGHMGRTSKIFNSVEDAEEAINIAIKSTQVKVVKTMMV